MKKITFNWALDYENIVPKETLTLSDNYTDEEIEMAMQDVVLEKISIWRDEEM